VESEPSLGVTNLTQLDSGSDYGLVTRTDNFKPYIAEDHDFDRAMAVSAMASPMAWLQA
jgi:hypothetical protein